MPTTNPVPSTDPTDLLFNAGKLDEVVNGAANSFTDRLGVARRTVAGMNADFDAQLADAESDLNVYRADAAASAAEALGYLQTIRATSYGAYAEDPTTDPLGNPPTEGDEYWNTTAKLLKRWNGATWQASDINTANLAASSGSSLVGYDGGTVQDVLDGAKSLQDYAALRAYIGRASRVYITGLLVTAKPAGIAGVFQYDPTDTTSADNGGTIIVGSDGRRWKRDLSGSGSANVKWFGALGNNTGNDAPAINAAHNAHDALDLPPGNYRITEPLVQTKTFILRGAGSEASRIVSAVSDILHLGKVGGFSNGSVIENIGLISEAGGGHIFVQKSSVLLYEFKNLYIEQRNGNKSVYDHAANLGNCLWNLWEGGRYFHAYGATVPGFNFVVGDGGATNANTWRNIDFVRASRPWFYFESTRANNYIYDLTFDRVSFSVTGGGCFVGKGVNSVNFNDFSVYDLEFGGNLNSAHLFHFYRGTNVSNQPSRNITFRNFRRIAGASQLNGYQDVYFDKPATGYSVEQVQFYNCSDSITGSLLVTTNTDAVLSPASYSSRLTVTGDPIPSFGSNVNNARSNGVAQTLQMSGSVSNYTMDGAANTLFCEPIDAARNLTGIKLASGLPASPLVPHVYIYNKSATQNLVLVHNASSTEANRFYCPGAVNLTVPPLSGKTAVYNHELQRWCIL